MDKKANDLFKKMMTICEGVDAYPVILFANGSLRGRGALLMVAGPVLTLENIKKLREEITYCLDEKEKQLRGESGPDTAIIYH